MLLFAILVFSVWNVGVFCCLRFCYDLLYLVCVVEVLWFWVDLEISWLGMSFRVLGFGGFILFDCVYWICSVCFWVGVLLICLFLGGLGIWLVCGRVLIGLVFGWFCWCFAGLLAFCFLI